MPNNVDTQRTGNREGPTHMTQRPRLVYDGICNLCTAAVRFLHILDKRQNLEYVAYQQLGSGTLRQYGLTVDALQGRMHLIPIGGYVASGSIALREVCKLLAPLTFICKIFGTQLAQRLYDWIARRRYRVFGCRDACYVVSAARLS